MEIPPGVELIVREPTQCTQTIPLQSANQIETFCQSNTFQSSSRLFRLPGNLSDSSLQVGFAIPLTAQPNPFTDELTLRYELETEAQVQIVMVDMMGRPVRQILPGSHRKSGPQEMTIDLSDLASGLYTVMLQVGNARQTVKVVKR